MILIGLLLLLRQVLCSSTNGPTRFPIQSGTGADDSFPLLLLVDTLCSNWIHLQWIFFFTPSSIAVVAKLLLMLLLFSCMSHLPTSGGGGRVLYSLQQQQHPHHPPARLIFLSTGDDVPLGANVLAWTSSLFCSIACCNNRVVFKSFVELQEGEKNKLANMYRHSGPHLVGRVCALPSCASLAKIWLRGFDCRDMENFVSYVFYTP